MVEVYWIYIFVERIFIIKRFWNQYSTSKSSLEGRKKVLESYLWAFCGGNKLYVALWSNILRKCVVDGNFVCIHSAKEVLSNFMQRKDLWNVGRLNKKFGIIEKILILKKISLKNLLDKIFKPHEKLSKALLVKFLKSFWKL